MTSNGHRSGRSNNPRFAEEFAFEKAIHLSDQDDVLSLEIASMALGHVGFEQRHLTSGLLFLLY